MKKTLRLIVAIVLATFAAGATIQAQSPTGRIRGVVVDAASGRALPYVAVAVQSGSQAAVTNENGEFTLPPLPVGRHTVVAALLGYESATVREVMISSAKETVLNITLTESLQKIDQVVVRPDAKKDEPLNSMALAGARQLNIEEAGRFAGGMDDPARLVTAFAGAVGSVSSNSISIRGNSPQSLQWKLEGVEIPNPNHFPETTGVGGGVLTIFSSNMLANSDFFAGAFPAQYNNALSGVFDMALRNGNNQRFEHTVQIGTIGAEIGSEGPFKKGKGSYLVNYRYSILAPMAKLFGGKMEDIEGVKYQDLSFKFNVPTRGAGTFTLWGVAGYDSIIDPDMSREEQDKEELFPYKQSGRMWTGATGLGHRIFFSPNTYLKSTLAGTYSRNIIKLGNYEEYVLKPVMDMRDINTNLIFNTYVNAKTSARHTNRTGVTVTGIFYDDNYNVAPGEHHFTGQIENFVDTDGSSVMASVFSQSMFQLTDALQAEVGVNGQYFAWNENFTIEPRVSFRMRVAPKHTIGLATGMHSRRERLDYYFVSNASTGNKMVNKDLDVAKAYHVTTSWDWSITPDLHMKVEPYFQYLYDVPVFPGTSKSVINQTNFWMDEKLVNNGEGRNYGVDLTLERYLKNGFYWMLTGSVFDSQYTGDDDEWHNTRYNRRWLVNVLGGKEWMLGSQKRHLLGVHLRINATGGAWYTPLNMAESLATQDSVEDESKMMSKQWPSIFTVHANIDWQINRPRVSHHVGFNMINVTGTEDRYGFDYNRRHQRMDEAKNAWLLPNLYYRISF